MVSSAFDSPAALRSLHHPLAAALDQGARHHGMSCPSHGLGTDRYLAASNSMLLCRPQAAYDFFSR